MVRIFIVILMLVESVSFLLSQNSCDEYESVFGTPEEFPVFCEKESNSDLDELLQFIAENINYPSTAKNDSVEGRVAVKFWIDTDGSTSEHRVIKSVRKDLDEEALRVARLIKFDKPAMSGGIPQGMCFTVPISFVLSRSK
ncbi:MAG: energy transducer TonB [Bacteroidales bacterium]|nr:energy transducer TonB [Bacteroidales bacterium]